MRKKFLLLIISSLLFALLAPLANAGLVQCVVSGPNSVLCNFCQLLATIQATLNFIMGLAFLGAVILIAVNGIRMYFTGGNPSKVKDAFQNIVKVVVGLVIVITAWVIINTVVVFLARPGSPPTFWNNISC